MKNGGKLKKTTDRDFGGMMLQPGINWIITDDQKKKQRRGNGCWMKVGRGLTHQLVTPEVPAMCNMHFLLLLQGQRKVFTDGFHRTRRHLGGDAVIFDIECADSHERVTHVLKELGSCLQIVEIPKRKGLDRDRSCHWKFGNNHRFRDGRNFNKCWCDRAG